MHNKPLVGIVMGSISDSDIMDECVKTLKEMDINFEITVSSAHRSPDKTRDYAMNASHRGIEVLIAGAGWAAHLAGVLASYTTLPVIGVPIDSSPLRGIDSLLSTAQMPPLPKYLRSSIQTLPQDWISTKKVHNHGQRDWKKIELRI